jgi:hypothetical protein
MKSVFWRIINDIFRVNEPWRKQHRLAWKSQYNKTVIVQPYLSRIIKKLIFIISYPFTWLLGSYVKLATKLNLSKLILNIQGQIWHSIMSLNLKSLILKLLYLSMHMRYMRPCSRHSPWSQNFSRVTSESLNLHNVKMKIAATGNVWTWTKRVLICCGLETSLPPNARLFNSYLTMQCSIAETGVYVVPALYKNSYFITD